MSKRQWMVLLMLFLTYLLLGASIFYHIESRLEIEKVAKAREERIEINALLHNHYMPRETQEQHEILERLTRYCGKSVYNYTANETDPLKWDFYNSFYFAYTVVSTIGYGNLAPTNMLSRILMIFYGVVGIPMNGILLSQLGEFFGLVFVRAHKKYKSYKHSQADEYAKKLTPLETRKAGLAAQFFMYLIPGFVMFIFFPAFLFSHYEGWTYDEAVYYAFVTLTTIGFGDYVAGQDNTKGDGVYFIMYKTFLIAWISFGLGYIVMIMTFIARGMRSKKITRLEHKLAMNLKHTQSKIWNEFNKEVSYLRRVFNELQLSKVKRVYMDEYDYEAPPTKFPRSTSFPDLRDLVYGGLPNPQPLHPRRRANSEVVPIETPVARVVSETDLQRIDRKATFATHAMVQPAELLARLVNVLGYIPPSADDDHDDSPTSEINKTGVQGFTDKDILANEKSWNTSTWKLGGDNEKSEMAMRKPRSRAASEIRLDPKYDPNVQQRNVEWTWSGPSASRKIQELIKARRNVTKNDQKTENKDGKSKFPNLGLPISVSKALLPRWMKQFSNKREVGQRSRNSISVGDLESRERENYMTEPTGNLRVNEPETGMFSNVYDHADSSTRPYFTHTGAANLASSLENSNLLEETSLADFLRALTALHTRVGAVPDEYVRKPQRKMGTACLTPPKLPSLFTLFSPLSGVPSATQSHQNTMTGAQAFSSNNADRRFSLRNADNSGTATINYSRRNSLAHHPGVMPRRRFSLRPVVMPLGNSPQNGSPYLSNLQRHVKDSVVPASSSYNSEGFVVECPKDSLVDKEGALGVSTPITASTGIRRFSLRPTAQTEIHQSSIQNPSPLTKGLPRWRAGMLQRQINQINLQKRVRAFSLSDVNTEPTRMEKNPTSALSPLVDGVRIVETSKDLPAKSFGQKTVTIVSPRTEELSALRTTNDSKQFGVSKVVDSSTSRSPTDDQDATALIRKPRIPYVRAVSATNNPFASLDEAKSSIVTNPFDPRIAQRTSGNDETNSSSFAGQTNAVDANSEAVTTSTMEKSSKEYVVIAPTNDSVGKTVYQALRSVKNIETAPRVALRDSGDEISDSTSSRNVGDDKKSKDGEMTMGKIDSVDKNAISSSSGSKIDGKEVDRKVSAVSTSHWKDSIKSGSRKISEVSEIAASSSSSVSSGSSSRKSSTNKNPNEKPRISIDSYKPLTEVKIEKPSENPFERYRATMRMSTSDVDSLNEVKVEIPESKNVGTNRDKFFTKLGQSPRESHS